MDAIPYNKALAEAVCSFLDQRFPAYCFVESLGRIVFNSGIHWANGEADAFLRYPKEFRRLEFRLRILMKGFTFCAVLPLRVDTANQPRLLKFAALVNEKTLDPWLPWCKSCAFQVDPSDGEIRLHFSCGGWGDLPQEDMVQLVEKEIDLCIDTMEMVLTKFAMGLVSVFFYGRDSEKAVMDCEIAEDKLLSELSRRQMSEEDQEELIQQRHALVDQLEKQLEMLAKKITKNIETPEEADSPEKADSPEEADWEQRMRALIRDAAARREEQPEAQDKEAEEND